MNRLKSALAGFAIATLVTAGTAVCTQTLIAGMAAGNPGHATMAHAVSSKPDALGVTSRARLTLW